MATKFSTCFLCWNFSGLNCKHSNVRFPPQSCRLFPASCRMRQHNLSSHHKKQRIRKASQEQPTTGSGLHLNDDGDSELKMVSPDGTSSLDKKNLTRTHTDYSDHIEHTNAVNLNSPTVLAETTPPVTNIDGVEKTEQLSDSQLKDLLAKIGNAEKNILLLNQARLCAVKDLENIVAEKEALQGEIKILEMRLAEAVAQIKVASQEKIHVELLEEQLDKMHIKLIHRGSTERGETQLHQSQHRVSIDEPVEDMPWEFWSQILLIIDGWMLEKKLSTKDAALLREMAWKRDRSIHDTYIACKEQNEHEAISAFLRLTSSAARPGLHVIHIAAEMAPVAKVGGLADAVTGLSKALQKKGHLVEIVLPKYDCMKYDGIHDFRALDVVIESYFDGQLFRNKIWLGTVEGLPVYFIEPHHPNNFFWRGNIYGEHDDFKRFSFFSRAALEFLLQAGKKPDIIHCHDWQTAFVAPMYWEIYASKGLDSARICFTCHNFEHQGIASASDLASCGLDVQRVNRPDRMQDNSADDKVNVVKGGIIFSNIVTTVSPTYAQEVQTAEGGHGLHSVLASHSRKFCGILNGIDTDAWNPSTDIFLKVQYSANDLHGKTENKESIRRQLDLSSADFRRPLVSCITRLVPQKGVHLIRHAMYQTLELGGQFVLLGSSPVKHIQKEFEGIANCFQNHDDIRLILKYDEFLSHAIYAASDMFIIPSIFEPCGLTQMISMRYGAIPIARRTGGLKDSVFDIDDNTVPSQFRNGFTFLNADEQGLSNALERAFNLYMNNPESWQQLVQKDMNIDFSWESSVPQYEDLYLKAVTRERERAPRRL